MKQAKKYFISLFKQAAELTNIKLSIIEEQDNYFLMDVHGITFECILIQTHEERVVLRTFIDALVANVFNDSMDEVFKLINRFNLTEGGVYNLVAIENEEEQYMSIALKTIDIVMLKNLADDEKVKEYHINLLADILNYVNCHSLIKEHYLDKIEEYSEFN